MRKCNVSSGYLGLTRSPLELKECGKKRKMKVRGTSNVAQYCGYSSGLVKVVSYVSFVPYSNWAV